MKSNEKYKRLLKIIFSATLATGVCLIYSAIWIGYYNQYILQAPFYRRGNWVMVLLYGILIIFFLYTYGGFKIGYLKNGTLIYSQAMSIAFVNLITYIQIAVIDKRFVGPFYMLILTAAQLVFIALWTIAFKLIYVKIFPPRKMLLIEGERNDYHLKEKMDSREDKYEISQVISYRIEKSELKKKIREYEGTIIGDIPSHERNMILKYCFEIGQRTYSVPKVSDILLRSSDELNLFDTPLLLSRNQGLTIEQEFFKRMEDIAVALFLLIVFFPVFLLAAIAIWCTDGGSIFYQQKRLTKDGKLFNIYKFRTMVKDAEKIGEVRMASQDDKRILPVGRFLRKTRLDELPQLINVLKGDMSMVGPRPERPELTALIEKKIPEFSYRLKIKAGLTGYAQIYGKYNTTSYDKLKLDLTYIRRYSILLDIKLMIMTPKIMLMKESSEGVKEWNIEDE